MRDLNLDSTYVDELLDRMQLEKTDRELIFDSLPTIYVNGKYFGVGLFGRSFSSRTRFTTSINAPFCLIIGAAACRTRILLCLQTIQLQNDGTLIQENEKRQLGELLRDFKGRRDCHHCQGSGYTVCSKCRGGKKAGQTFSVRLKCATCDENGIAPCLHCAPRPKLDS